MLLWYIVILYIQVLYVEDLVWFLNFLNIFCDCWLNYLYITLVCIKYSQIGKHSLNQLNVSKKDLLHYVVHIASERLVKRRRKVAFRRRVHTICRSKIVWKHNDVTIWTLHVSELKAIMKTRSFVWTASMLCSTFTVLPIYTHTKKCRILICALFQSG